MSTPIGKVTSAPPCCLKTAPGAYPSPGRSNGLDIAIPVIPFAPVRHPPVMAAPGGGTSRGVAASRLLTPAGFALALICFLFGFLAVSCDTPGGYGRTGQGGTTTYTGLDLAVGTSPTIERGHLDPDLTTRSDLLGWQPAIALAALVLMVGFAAGVSVLRHRRLLVVSSAAAGAVLLVLGALIAHQQLAGRVADQVREPLPPGKVPGDYVVVGGGFTTALTILVVVLVCHLAGHLGRRGLRIGRPRPSAARRRGSGPP
jgi:hypothetical protein